MIGHELIEPELDGDDDAVLSRAYELARDEEFQEKRRAYYDWQEQQAKLVIDGDKTVDDAVAKMNDLVADYNRTVEKKLARKRRWRQTYTLLGGAVAVGLTILPLLHGAPLEAAANFAGGALPVLTYYHLDRHIELPDGPAAMFYAVTRAR